MIRPLVASAVVLGISVALPRAAHADDPSWDMQLKIESDVRFRLETKSAGGIIEQTTLPRGIERNQNLLGAKFAVAWENVRAVAQTDLVVYGYQTTLEGFSALSDIQEEQPYRIDVNELYVEVQDLFFDGLNLRVGQQIVAWGVADQFNPTNTLNPDDLIDPLLFGKQLGNFMLKADYWVTDDFSISAVLVPLFRPARIPTSAALGPAQVGRTPWVEKKLRWRTETERGAAGRFLNVPTAIDTITIITPEPQFENMQAAFRLAGTVLEQDIALSYYTGFHDFPVPVQNHTKQNVVDACGGPPFGGICTTAANGGILQTDTTLSFPKMHAYGLNLAGEFNPFSPIDPNIGGIGYRLEGALFIPRETKMKLTQDDLSLGGGVFLLPGGEYDYDQDGRPGGPRPTVVEEEPFLKWTLGLDYTFPGNVYANLMWVHGLPDEYGAGDWIGGSKEVRESSIITESLADLLNTDTGCVSLTPLETPPATIDGTRCARETLRPKIGDYLVAGVDVRWLDDQLLTRLFTIIEMSGYELNRPTPSGDRRTIEYPFYTPEGFSAVIFPEASYNWGNGLEVGIGALFNLGKRYTKFGDPAAGGSITFLRAKYTL
jgi:hypothetical protein